MTSSFINTDITCLSVDNRARTTRIAVEETGVYIMLCRRYTTLAKDLSDCIIIKAFESPISTAIYQPIWDKEVGVMS